MSRSTDVFGHESFSPSERKRVEYGFDWLSTLDADALGRAAYEAFQGRYAAELSDALKQNAPSKKPVPTGARTVWNRLDRATQETWIRVAKAVVEAAKNGATTAKAAK